MLTDSTTRLLQILRTSLALIKCYEGHPAAAATMIELKRNLQRAIEELAAIEAAEKDAAGTADFAPEMDISELDPERKR
jgi:predicted nuclease with RNAse H fold